MTPARRWVMLLVGAGLFVLAVWSVLDGPLLTERTAPDEEASEPSVQCYSPISGPWSTYDDYLENGDSRYADTYGVEDLSVLDEGDRVHEGQDVSTQEPGPGDDQGRVDDANETASGLIDKLARCERARNSRIAKALLLAPAGALMFGLGLTARLVPAPPRQRGYPALPWVGGDNGSQSPRM